MVKIGLYLWKTLKCGNQKKISTFIGTTCSSSTDIIFENVCGCYSSYTHSYEKNNIFLLILKSNLVLVHSPMNHNELISQTVEGVSNK